MTDLSLLYSDQRLFRLIVEASPAGMIIVNDGGRIVLVNPRAEEQFGYKCGELLEKSVEILIPDAHHVAHVAHRARYMSHPEPRPMAAGRDLFAKRKDGSEFPVDISLHPIQVGESMLILANVLDATDRRRAEQEREARQTMERLALLGQLAGGVAHEIRTPLCVIRNDVYYLQMLADQLGYEGAQCVQEIDEAVGKANRIVSELLDLARDPASHRADVNILDVVATAIREADLPEGITLNVSRDDDGLVVNADPGQLERILVNLLRNASQAMGESGHIEIRVTGTDGQVVIAVTDSGPGIDERIIDKVFEPLFTTKPKGIGLGLAVSQRYALRNDGKLTASNGPDGGACFRLILSRCVKVD